MTVDAEQDAAASARAAKRVAKGAQADLAEAREALAGVTQERDEARTALEAAQARIAELEAAADQTETALESAAAKTPSKPGGGKKKGE